MNRCSQFAALSSTVLILSGCSTETDMVTSNLPESYSGRASIVESLHVQQAYLYRGGHSTASMGQFTDSQGYRPPDGRHSLMHNVAGARSCIDEDYLV